MWDKEGSGFFGIEGLCDGTEYIHLGNWVIVAEDEVISRKFFVSVFRMINIFAGCSGFGWEWLI